MTATWVEIAGLAEELRDYAYKHAYTDDEAERLNDMADRLIALEVRVEDEAKQLKRTAGGLSNKVRSMASETGKLEARLEELEGENADLRAYRKNQESPAAKMAPGYCNQCEGVAQ